MSDRRFQLLWRSNKIVFELLLIGLVFRVLNSQLPSFIQVQSAYAFTVSQICGYFIDCYSNGIFVVTDSVRYAITRDCLGWKSMFVFGALCVSSRKKGGGTTGVVCGLAVIVLLNFIRIVFTVTLAQNGVPFDLLHDVLWRWGLTGSVLIIWIFWYSELTPFKNGFV